MTNLNSFRRATLLGLSTGALLLAFAAPSFAGGANNPDVYDINLGLDATSGSSLDNNEVRFRAGQSADNYFVSSTSSSAENSSTPGTYLKGYASQSDNEAGNLVRLVWFAYEPDSVKRTETGLSLRQKSNIALAVYTTDSGYGQTDVIEGCSAKGKIKVNQDNGATKASASLKCPKSVWEDLGFGANQIEAIQNILGSTKIKFGFKGTIN